LVLADARGREMRVPKDMVEDRCIAPLSLMPADLAARIDESELDDLLAYLLERRSSRGLARERDY
jgi:hypothetical protein